MKTDIIFKGVKDSVFHHLLRLRFVLTFAVLTAVSSLVSQTTPFRSLSYAFLDVWRTLLPDARPKLHCRLVAITDVEYESLFALQSPLDPETLSRVISRLLEYKPAVLAIDIDTSHRDFSRVPIPTGSLDTAIVWARDGWLENETPRSIRPMRIWGTDVQEPLHSGMPIAPVSLDGLIRGHQRKWPWGSRFVDSFHWAIVKAYCASRYMPGCPPHDDGSEAAFTLITPILERDDAKPLPLSDFYRKESSEMSSPSEENILSKQIVILGGTYRAARDVHRTPQGMRSGLELLADAVESDLGEKRVRTIPKWLGYAVKALIAIIIASLYHYLRPWAAMLAVSVALTAVIGLGSLAAYAIGYYWADQVPFLVGLWLEQVLTQTEEMENAHRGVAH